MQNVLSIQSTEPPFIENLVFLDASTFAHSAVRKAASRAGCVGRVVCFRDATTALNFIRSGARIDLLLVDFSLSVSKESDLLAAAKNEFGRDIARAFYVCVNGVPDQSRYEETGACSPVSGWIEKPINPENLLAIADHLHQAEMDKSLEPMVA